MTETKKVKFENKLLDSEFFEEKYTYNNLAKMCLNTPPSRGVSFSQMIDRLDVIKIFDNVEGIEVSAAQLNLLISSFEGIAWKFVDEKVIKFYKYIKELKEIF